MCEQQNYDVFTEERRGQGVDMDGGVGLLALDLFVRSPGQQRGADMNRVIMAHLTVARKG